MLVNSIKTKNNFHNYIVIKQSDNTSAIEIFLCGANGSILSDLNQSCTLTILDEVDQLIRQKTKEQIVNGTVTFRVTNDLKTNPHTLEITTADGQKFPSNHDFKIFVSYTHDESELKVINNLSRDEALAEIDQSVKRFISENTEEYIDKVATSKWLANNEFKPKAAVETFSELPKSAELKELRGVTNENSVYVYDGAKWIKQSKLNFDGLNEMRERVKNSYDYGAKGDGLTDDTAALQRQLDNETYVKIDRGTYLINDVGLKIPSNRQIIMNSDAIIKKTATNLNSYNIFDVQDVEKIHISGGTIVGDRDSHTGTSGEWGMGIALRGTKDVVVQGTRIEKCWGDGVYIGASTKKNYCENTLIDKISVDKCRRNGISVISVKGLKIVTPIIRDIGGTAPGDGIDIEPNFNTEFLEDITINGIKTERCDGAGITVFLNRFGDASSIVNININEHQDDGSNEGYRVIADVKNLDGTITSTNPTFKNNIKKSVSFDRIDPSGLMYIVKNPTVFASQTLEFPYELTHVLSTTKTEPALGNLRLENPKLIIPKGVTAPTRFIYVGQGTSNKLKNFKVIDPQIKDDQKRNVPFILSVKNAENFELVDSFSTFDILDNKEGFNPITMSNYGSLIRSVSATTFLINKIPLNTNVTIINDGGNFTGIQFDNTVTDPIYYPLGRPPLAQKYVYSSAKGASITFKRISDNEVLILNMIGNWDFKRV